jgi:hypothetical protein
MDFILIFPSYVRWHYSRGLRDSVRLWRTFLTFIYDFFSIPLLLANLFSPWQRMSDEHRKGESVGDMAFTLIFNVIMRAVGFVMRAIFIIAGIIGLVVGTVVGIVLLAAWIMLPVIIAYLLLIGMRQLSI